MSAGQQEAQGTGSGRLHPAAYRELQAGETYEPYVPAGAAVPEFTVRSVTLGIIMVIVFAVASTYSGLKIAQVMEAAIPISILAVGVSGLFVRKNSILENVIVQSIGGASGLVVSGSIFTLPALYIMNVAPGTALDAADDLHRLGAGVVPGPALPHPAAALLRRRAARETAVPRGDRHQRGLRHGREGRRAGEDPGGRRVRRRRSTTSWPSPSGPGTRRSTSSSSPR